MAGEAVGVPMTGVMELGAGDQCSLPCEGEYRAESERAERAGAGTVKCDSDESDDLETPESGVFP